ncbi:hypothetical protein DD570_18500 [Klebsiella pneumoniae]|nr:hypothetical protein DD570_18500 [Klebsiella pneumoniae]
MRNNCLPTAIAEKPYLLDELTYETECVLAILRTINDVSDPHTKSITHVWKMVIANEKYRPHP